MPIPRHLSVMPTEAPTWSDTTEIPTWDQTTEAKADAPKWDDTSPVSDQPEPLTTDSPPASKTVYAGQGGSLSPATRETPTPERISSFTGGPSNLLELESARIAPGPSTPEQEAQTAELQTSLVSIPRRTDEPVGTRDSVEKGIYNAMADLVEGMATPEMLATIPWLALPGAPGAIIKGIVAADMAKGSIGLLPEIYQASERGDTAEVARLSALYGANALMAIGLGKHAVTQGTVGMPITEPGQAAWTAGKMLDRAVSEPGALPVLPVEPLVRSVSESGSPMTAEALAKTFAEKPAELVKLPGEKPGEVSAPVAESVPKFEETVPVETRPSATTSKAIDLTKDESLVGQGPRLAVKLDDGTILHAGDLRLHAQLVEAAGVDHARVVEAGWYGKLSGEFRAGASDAVRAAEDARKNKLPAPVPEVKAVSQPELIGMGGAVPEEFIPSFRESTGIKKAAIEEARAERGAEPIEPTTPEAQKATLERVKAKVYDDPGYLDRLTEELSIEPRPINPDEVLALDMRYVELQTERAKAIREGEQAASDGRIDDVARAQDLVQMWDSKLGEFEQTVTRSKSLWGRSGAMMKRRIKADFSLEAMEQRARASKGFKPLTEDERVQVKKQFDEISAANQKFQERVAQLETEKADVEARAVLAELKAGKVPEFHPSVLEHAERFVVKLEATADRYSKELFGATWSPTPDMLAKAAFIGAARLARGIVEVGKWTDAMVRDIGEKFRPYADQVYEMAKKALDEQIANAEKVEGAPRIAKAVKRPIESSDRESEIKAKLGAKFEQGKDAEISPLVNQLARLFVERGIKELDPLLKSIHEVLKEIDPEITLRETQDALSGYGKFTLPKQDAVSKIVSDLKGQALEVGKLLDLEAGEPLKRTGFLRGKMSDVRRRLVAKVNEYKRKFGVSVSDPATQLASALDARKTYYRNQISDLEAQIKSRQRFIKTKTPSPTDAELESMITRRNALKEEFDSIFSKPEMTSEQRLKIALSAAERSEKEWNQRLENAKAGKFGSLKKPSEKVSTPELEAIRARTEAVREQVKELKDLATPKKSPEEIALQSLVTRMKTRTADLLERTAKGEFAPKTKREPLDISKDPEAMKAAAALKSAQVEFEIGREKFRLANRSAKQIAMDTAIETANLLRNQITSLDVSAPGRQGFWLTVGNPSRALRAGKEMFRTMFSEERAMEIEAGIANRPNAKLYEKSGLRIVDQNETRFSKQEEVARGRWANAVPWIRSSNRMFVTYLNVLRADSFDAMWKSLPDKSPEAAKALAEGINDMTGYGSFGRASHMADAASTVLWSPRLLASRFHILTGRSLRQGPGAVRKAFAAEYAKTLTGIAALYSLGKMAGGTVETDPRSSDFGKIKFGNTRLDPLGGLLQITVLASRLISGKTKTIKGDVLSIRGPDVKYGQSTGYDVMANFLRTKLRPEIGAVVDLSTGKNLVGEEVTAKSMITNFTTPLSFRDIYDVMRENGVPAGVALETLSLFGMGLQHFEPKKKGSQ